LRTLKIEALAPDAVSFTHFCHVFAEIWGDGRHLATTDEMYSLRMVRECFESSLVAVGWMRDTSLVDIGGVQVVKYKYSFDGSHSLQNPLGIYGLVKADLGAVISILERMVLSHPNSSPYFVGLFDICRAMVDAVSNYDWSPRTTT